MRAMHPLRGLPNQRQIWAWIAFDVANQSFTLIINTLLFALFFAEVIVQDPRLDDRYWSLTFGSSMLLTAVCSPILGKIADLRGWKKRLLIGTGMLCAVLTCCLGLLPPKAVALAMLLYIPANFAFQAGESLLSSFLPSLAPADQIGRVSGFSWACSYCAAFMLLLLTGIGMTAFGLREPHQWRPLIVFAGVWFLVFSIPTMLWLHEPARGHEVAHIGLRRLLQRDLTLLLVASLFYGTAMNVIIFFAGKLAAEYGFRQQQLILFVAVITVTGVFGTVLPMLAQDRLGHRGCVMGILVVWLCTTLYFAAFAAYHKPGDPTWPLWIIGNLLGFGLGALGTANRAFVGYLSKPGHEGETYGVWGMTMKLSAIMTFPFAWVRDTLGTAQSLLLLAGFVVAGMLITFFIDEKRGRASS